jgi:hypothetical protein
MASHDGNPTSLDAASRSMVWYIERMCFGAATVPGLACGALISALSAGESFDMLLMSFFYRFPISTIASGMNLFYFEPMS